MIKVKENVLAIIAVIALILSVMAVVLEVSYQISEIEPSKINGVAWTSDNDGSFSGLDADKLDELDSNQFIRNDKNGKLDGDLEINGDIDIDGNITHGLKTKYYSIPNCAFRPSEQDVEYLVGSYLYNKNPSYLEEHFLAPVYLPDGANIVRFKVYYTSEHELAVGDMALYGSTGVTTLFRYNVSLPGNHDQYDPPAASSDINEIVSNEDSAYWFYLTLDSYDLNVDIYFALVTIEYTITNP